MESARIRREADSKRIDGQEASKGASGAREPDAHLRPALSYDWSDGFGVTAGANVMLGDAETFFGQLSDASNVYVRGRYSF